MRDWKKGARKILNYEIKDFLKKFFGSRLFVLAVVMLVLFSILLGRVFSLQIVNGSAYQDKFEMLSKKQLSVEATRGNIYDRQGRLLAYNELAYSVIISDQYKSSSKKNGLLNDELAEIIAAIEKNGDKLYSEFKITYQEDGTYSFKVEGSQLKRFLADVFGKSNYDDLNVIDESRYLNGKPIDGKLNFNPKEATPEQVMEYLMYSSNKYGVDEEKYGSELAYKIVALRYAISENRYSQYKTTTIAKGVSDATVAYINEHSDTLLGVEIREDTIRKYNYSEYMAAMIGYTGKISPEEYTELSERDETYTPNDVVGKSGLEQYYESFLRGKNGEKEVYLNNVGRITKVIKSTESIAGNDLYLSIDAELQAGIYQLLEQEIAGILYGAIRTNFYSINDVYFAMINNNLVDISHFDASDAGANEQQLYQQFIGPKEQNISWVYNELANGSTTNKQMSEELLDYMDYIISQLKANKIIDTNLIDSSDETYKAWKEGTISPKEYLSYCIEKQWIDITQFAIESKYADLSEIYQALLEYISNTIMNSKGFAKIVYKYMCNRSMVDGHALCMALYEQGVFSTEDSAYEGLSSGSISPYSYLLDKIYTLQITPAMLAMDPCTGSCVMTDTKTGEVLALVSYPGYDNNRLANTVDADYFKKLNEDLSKPQYNYATQERTAPGSTFKMVTSTAGLMEGKITPESIYSCHVVFDKIDNKPECWNKSGHGDLNLSNAIKESCNVYYYNLGYDMSMDSNLMYDEKLGISKIQKYAALYGLDQKSGLEIEENTSEVATKYPVMAAIGQSDNNYTTVALSRYVTALASGKLYDYKLLNKIVDQDGNTIKSYEAKSEDISSNLNEHQWSAIRTGMEMVTDSLASYKEMNSVIKVAGKTGTAEQIKGRPAHAVFVGYAPASDPQVSVATRIAFGNSSHNSAQIAKNAVSLYFGFEGRDTLLSGHAEAVETSNVITD